MSESSVPLTIIAGYLGAGKTTLLNHLLGQAEDRRVAVLVNDFGDINIDASLIKSRNADSIHLTNGCVCCSIRDNLAETLGDLVESDCPPDNIVLEASGVAEPDRLVSYSRGMPGLHLGGVIVLADAETLSERAKDKFVGSLVQRQIQSADLLVLNKADLANADHLSNAKALVGHLLPNAHILETEQAMVPIDVCLGVNSEDVERLITSVDQHEMNHDKTFFSWTYVCKRPFVLEKLEGVLNELPASLVRAKGFVRLDQANGDMHVLQMVGRRWTLEPWDFEAGRAMKSEIVFIAMEGLGAQSKLQGLLDQCVSQQA